MLKIINFIISFSGFKLKRISKVVFDTKTKSKREVKISALTKFLGLELVPIIDRVVFNTKRAYKRTEVEEKAINAFKSPNYNYFRSDLALPQKIQESDLALIQKIQAILKPPLPGTFIIDKDALDSTGRKKFRVIDEIYNRMETATFTVDIEGRKARRERAIAIVEGKNN